MTLPALKGIRDGLLAIGHTSTAKVIAELVAELSTQSIKKEPISNTPKDPATQMFNDMGIDVVDVAPNNKEDK